MTELLQTDHVHLARAIELAEAAAAGRRRTRSSAPSWSATARCWARASTPPTAAPTPSARRCARAARRRRAARRCTSRWSPAATTGRTPPCTDAILEAGHRPRRGRLRRPDREGLRPRPRASCATRASRSWSPTASSPPARGCSTSRSASTRAPGRPWVLFKSAMTLDGKVATRTGDSKWISGEDSRRLAHRWRAECDAVAVRHRHRAGRRPAAHRRGSRASTASRAGSCSTPRPACRWTPQLVQGAAELPLTVVVSRAASRRATDGARGRRRRRDRRHRRERARPRAQRARPARRLRRDLDPARGRPAPGRRVPRRRRGRRDPPVRRAGRARRLAPRATRSRARASSASPRPRARSRSSASASPTTS